jgi:hypothetical protein
MRSTGLGVLFSCLVLILAPAGLAQNVQNNGTIQGTVVDAAGAAVAAAEITVVNDDIGTTRTAMSSSTGFYAFTELSPGKYHVTVKKEGFKAEVQSGIELHLGSTVVVDAKLTVGAVSETLTVEANAIQVDTTSGSLGVLTEGETVRDLPLNGLNFIGLTLLVPGASTQDGFNTSAKGLQGGTDISFSGGQRTGNLFTVDGSPINDTGSQRTIFVYPALDSIDEFKIATNSYGPEYGQSGGAQVNIITKHGTNDWHGSLFYFGRNDALNANNFFNKNTTPALNIPELRRNDFGGSVGGPIKKDKLFIFTSEEWNRQISGSLHTGQTPSAAEMAGDFTGATTGGHLTNCFFNASSGLGVHDFKVTDPGGPPGNTLTNVGSSVEGFSPAGQLIVKLFPAANVTPTAANPCPNPDYKQVLATPLHYYQTNVRADYVLNKSTTMFVKYTRDWWNQGTPSLAGQEWGEDGFPAVDSNWTQPSNLVTLRLSKTIGTSAVNDFQFSYAGNRINIVSGGTNPTLASQIYAAFTPVYPFSQKTAGSKLSPPLFWGPGGYSTLWNIAPWNNREDRYTWTDDYSKVIGKHQVRVGVLLAHNLKDQANNGDFNEAPAIWGASGTCKPVANCSSSWGNGTTGNAIANILLKGTSFGYGEPSTLHPAASRYQDYEWYVSDSFKATRRLTFNYGIRWSLLMQPYVSNNQLDFFEPSLFNPALPGGNSCNGMLLAPSSKNACAATGATAGFATASSRSIVDNSYHNIAPRLGVAYDLFGDGKTSLRAGVGQFYIRYQLDPSIIAGTQNAPFVQNTGGIRTLDSIIAPSTGFGNPGLARTLSTNIPNTWQWNVTVEREFLRNNTLQLSYVGTRGLHLQSYIDLPQIRPDCTGPAVTAAAPTTGTCRQEFAISRLNGGGTGGSTFRPYANYFGLNTANSIIQDNFDGTSTYHSLQALWRGKIDKRGSFYQATYTFSKLLSLQGVDGLTGQGPTDILTDNANPRRDYGPSDFDRRHIFTGSAVFNLPGMTNGNALERNALNGWSVNPIITFESGTPIIPQIGPNLSGNGTGFDRPNRVSGQPCTISVPGTKQQILNPNAFTINGFVLGTYGNSASGNCYGPGLDNWDLGIHKDFKLTERVGMQFRLELFNAFNKAEFQGINNGINPSQLCFADQNGVAVAVTGVAGNPCFLNGNPLGQNIPSNAYQVVPSVNVGGVTGNTLVSPNFGQATFTRGAREIQYALRFTF